MWTIENRARYNRNHLRYPSDLTDDANSRGSRAVIPRDHGQRFQTIMGSDSTPSWAPLKLG